MSTNRTMAASHAATVGRLPFPVGGTPWPEVRVELDGAREGDYSWREGRMPLYIYWLDDQLEEVAKEASSMFYMENGLGRRAFPSVQRLQSQVIEMALSLFNAPNGAGGSFTSGGTESIFQAVHTARGLWEEKHSGPDVRPTIVTPNTAHPAFNKAAAYLKMEVLRIPVGPDFRADVAAMVQAIDERTALIVGSAPAYPHGVFDPVRALSDAALASDVPLHVDACVGGFLNPFMKMNGEAIPDFDFLLPGVTSMSADIHKYGFSAKGASLVLYRDASLKRFQRFEFDDWPRGHYATETFLGTRPASPVASAWAVFHYLGTEGYRRIAGIVAETAKKMRSGIDAIPELAVVQPSESSFVLYESCDPSVDINAVAEQLGGEGWFVGRSVVPPAIHFMVNPIHAKVMDRYLADVRKAVSHVKAGRLTASMDTRTY